MNSGYFVAVLYVVAGVLVFSYLVWRAKNLEKAYRRIVPVPQSLLSLGVEKRCYPDPHIVTFFINKKKVGKATSRLVQKDMDQLIANGHKVAQSYYDNTGNKVILSDERLSRFRSSMKTMTEETQGRPERHPDFSKLCPYAYISITVV
jgi:hypothetical protein